MAGAQRAGRRSEVSLQGDEIRRQRCQLVRERRPAIDQRRDDLRPAGGPDRLAVPGVDADRAHEVDVVEAGHEPADLARIEVEIRILEIDPLVDPDVEAVGIGDQRAISGATDLRCRDTGGARCFLKGCAVDDLGQLVVGHIIDLLDRPAAGVGVEAPDRAEPATRDRPVGEPAARPEVERREQRRDVTLAKAIHRESLTSRASPRCVRGTPNGALRTWETLRDPPRHGYGDVRNRSSTRSLSRSSSS